MKSCQTSKDLYLGSRVAQWSKGLHLSVRGITTVRGSNPGCIVSCGDWESQRVMNNWPRVGSHFKYKFVLNLPSLKFKKHYTEMFAISKRTYVDIFGAFVHGSL
jgi:hypothetical protein